MSPYLAMGNVPMLMVDPDGEFAFIPALIIIAKGAAIGAAIGGAAYTASVAMSNGGFDNWNWGQFGKSVGTGAIAGAATGGVKALGKAGVGLIKSAKTAKIMSSVVGGGVNMMNYHDAERGFGWHSLGYFAAGYIGTSVGIADNNAAGFFTGGVLNNFAGMAAGDIDNHYGMAQHFVGGGLSAIAGKNFHSSTSASWGLKKGKAGYILGDKLSDKFASYGLQNVAARFAFDSRQNFFDVSPGQHLGSFVVGGFGGLFQYDIMQGGAGDLDRYSLGTFAKLYGLSTLAYLGEYSANYWVNNPGLLYPGFRSYHNYKMASYSVKSFFYALTMIQ